MPVLLKHAKVISAPRLRGLAPRLVLGYKRTKLCHITRERTLRFHPASYTPKNFPSHVLALRSARDPEFGVRSQFVAEVVLGQSSFAMFRWPKDQGEVAGWCIFVRFDGFDMEPRGEVPEILTSETLQRAVPILTASLAEGSFSNSVTPFSEIGNALTPLVISRPCDTSDHARLRDSSMLRESFKEQFAGLLSPDFADVAATLFCRSISHGPKWSKSGRRSTSLPLTQSFRRLPQHHC